jgi:dCTP deaminase
MLGRNQILKAIDQGDILIDPFTIEHVGPNSVDLRLGDQLFVHELNALDMKKEPKGRMHTIPLSGFCMEPGELYLGATLERAGSKKYVPCIEGRSSVARLGLTIHASAGFGDRGFLGNWTLELSVVRPLWIYAGVRIAQVHFFVTGDDPGSVYVGKYTDYEDRSPKPSRMYREFTEPGRG